MTLQKDIQDDPKYQKVLDHGFVGLVDYMGSDSDIVSAARVSYGDGTKSVREDRGLIRYLVRNQHTSPLEMCEIKLHLKMPIFVMRQLVRHRTSSLNEYSARYSELTDEMYVPEVENILPQSVSNKQGRDGQLSTDDAEAAQLLISRSTQQSYQAYQKLLNNQVATPGNSLNKFLIKMTNSENSLKFSEDFPEQGIAREIARTVMPVAGYTEVYWKQNLHNLFRMLRLRDDSHAQWEIQQYAQAIYQLIKPLFPLACEAYEDYIKNAKLLSDMEGNLLTTLINCSNTNNISFGEAYQHLVLKAGGETQLLEIHRMSKRELLDFKKNFNIQA